MVEIWNPQVRVVYEGHETVIDVIDLVPQGEGVNYFDDVLHNEGPRNILLANAAAYIDRVGALGGYTVTRADNTGNIVISPKRVFGAE